MSDQPLNKRARQKQRREAKLEQQRAAERRARMVRLGVFVALGAVLAGLVGWAVLDRRSQQLAVQEQEERAAAQLSSLGCTPAEDQEDLGAGHLDGNELADNPPDALYPDRPATSGRHISNWVMTGVYDVQIDERLLVHNLEHGYVNVWYGADAPEEQVAELKETAQSLIDDGGLPKMIVAPWDGSLPQEDANFAYTGWGVRQTCRDFDADVFEVFARAHHSGAGDAPEKTLPPHLQEGNGTLDPGGEDLLLPPLGQSSPESEGMEEGATEDVLEGETEPAEDSS